MCIFDTTPFWVKLIKTIIPPLIVVLLYLMVSFKKKNFKKYLGWFIVIFIIVALISYASGMGASFKGC